jgi:DNA-binding SARP family transcriptional activator
VALHTVTVPVRISDDSAMQKPTVSAELRVRLYGESAVVLPDGHIVALERRAAALLALAALEPGISRLRVASMLWPDSKDPRRNLRQQLLRFRQLFDHPLVEGDSVLSVKELLIEAADNLSPAPLLAGHEYEDCEEFAAWLSQQREARHARLLETTRQQLANSEAAGDLDAALAAANALLALDHRAESHHRELMRLNYLRGDSAAGLTAYRRLSEMLAADFDTRPSAPSEELAAVLRSHAQHSARAAVPRSGAGSSAALPVALKRPPRLAGRASESAAVAQHWTEGRAVLLEGEAGLGKSRLISELLADTCTALSAAGRPGDAGAPYATLARLLRPLLADGAADLDAPTREALAHITSSVAPALSVHSSSVEKTGAASAGAPALAALRPGAMAAAVHELLRQRNVQVIALDDLHFADEATIELVASLAAQGEPPRCWLLAARPAELSPSARELRVSLTELRRLSIVPLSALDACAIATLVDGLAIDGLDANHLAEPLLRHTGGNPLFVLETLKQGLADGSLARGELPRPLSVGALIERRLQRVSEPALALARVAAIAGVDFNIELAEAAIGVRAVQLASAWSELQDAQVLRGEAFAHDLVSDAVLLGVPPVVARRMHAQCAAWLSARGGEPARLARHWRLGGHPAEAALAFEQAATRAGQASRRHEEAELLLEAAQAHADAGQPAQRFEALAARVSALIVAKLDERALEEARALPDAAQDDLQRVSAIRVLAELLGQSGEMQQAIDVAQPGLALARKIGAYEELVRNASNVAANLSKLGRPEEAYSLLLPLREWVDRDADDDVRSVWYGHWAGTLGHIGRLREAVASFDVSIACAERTGRRDAVGMAVLNMGVVLRTMGCLQRAFECSRRGVELTSGDIAATTHLTLARLMHARDQAETGRYADALQALDDLMPQLEEMGTVFWVRAAQTTQAAMWLHLGQVARAQQLLRPDDAEMPAWMRASRALLRMEIAAASAQPLPLAQMKEALALVGSDRHRIAGMATRALRAATAQEVLEQVPALAETSDKQERYGGLLALRIHEARAASALDRHAQASAAARQALALFADGYAPEFMYLPELHFVAWRVLDKAGASNEAIAALKAGTDWIRGHALPQVPAPFLDSFLNRNPVNRELLAAVARLQGPTVHIGWPQGAIGAPPSDETTTDGL